MENILREGLESLCKKDEEINRLTALRFDEILSGLSLYINEIETFNPAYGLVGTRDKRELIIKHILDSLSPIGIISRLLKESDINPQQWTQIADAGSGAGLPGIPLAVALPSAHFTLIERMGRRAGFLLNTIAVLSLTNIDVEENELEKTSESFNLITFRAFKPLEPKLLKTLRKLTAPKGVLAAYKGKREKINSEITLLNKQEKFNYDIIPYTVPFLDEERHLLVIKF